MGENTKKLVAVEMFPFFILIYRKYGLAEQYKILTPVWLKSKVLSSLILQSKKDKAGRLESDNEFRWLLYKYKLCNAGKLFKFKDASWL